jgi:hypothetical protein
VTIVLQRILDAGVTAGVFTPAADGVQALLVTRLLYGADELLHQHQLSQPAVADAITSLILDGIQPHSGQFMPHPTALMPDRRPR